MDAEYIENLQLTNSQVGIFYLGQEGFLIKYRSQYLLIDPYLTDYVDRNCCTDRVKWVRRYAPPISFTELKNANFVLCTHSHYDHADPDTLRGIAGAGGETIFMVPEPVKSVLLGYGLPENRVLGAFADTTKQLGEFTVTPIPAAHEELHPDEQGHYSELGYRISCGGFTICHLGDCCIYEGLAERLKDVDILMLPVNGRSWFKRYEDDIIGNMTVEEALVLADKTKPGLLVPMHYDLYDVNGDNPAHFVDALYRAIPRQRFHMFVPGECYIATK